MRRKTRMGLGVRVALAMVFSGLAVLDVGCAQMMQALGQASRAASGAASALKPGAKPGTQTRPGAVTPPKKGSATEPDPYAASGLLDKDGMPLARGGEIGPEEYECQMFGTNCPGSTPMPADDKADDCKLRTPEGACWSVPGAGMT